TSGSDFALARYWGDQAPPPVAIDTASGVYLNQVYEDLLGRQIDPSGLGFWQNALTAGATREQVAQGISSSHEYRGLQVDDLFRSLLHRQADPTGLDTFIA